ncbi:MAG: SAM-dependent chlorinase/fluorinase [Bacteroidales bacterium]|nr:SAM-dependent chlorinase/fluorinase [Bacteroidales bacterium]
MLVTLTSDWNLQDYYAGSLKGAIRSRCPGVEIVDISHQIRSFDIVQCAFVLRHAFAHFPSGSIHLIAVQCEPQPLVPMVIVYARDHYFVGLNDGRFSLLFDDPPAEAFALPVPVGPYSFASLLLFTRAVAAIVEGRVESETKSCVLQTESPGRPVYSASEIVGRVVYIDSYGNAITNISRALFIKVCQGRAFEIFVRGTFARLEGIVGGYDEVADGQMLALFNSVGCLEIAINKANFAQLESMDTHSEIRIKFYERKR